MNPEQVKITASEALEFLSGSGPAVPINSSSHPVVRVFLAVLDHKKATKTTLSFVSTVCGCLNARMVTDDALSAIVRRLENFEDTDDGTRLRIVQVVATIARDHFLEMHILQSILSILLSFCADGDELVRETAAAADQAVHGFLGETLGPVNQRATDLCFSMCGDSSVDFENHINNGIYLVLSDVVGICGGGRRSGCAPGPCR